MKKLENFHLLVMLIALIAVGQMTQTVYVPVITDIALDFGKPAGAVQSVMAAYLFTYGASQLIYGPISDKVGRRPVILTGVIYLCVIHDCRAVFTESDYAGDCQRVTGAGDRGGRGDGTDHAA